MTKYYIKQFIGSSNFDEYNNEPLFDTREEAFKTARKMLLELISNDIDYDDFDGDMSSSAFEYKFISNPYCLEYHSFKGMISIAIREYEVKKPCYLQGDFDNFFVHIADGGEAIVSQTSSFGQKSEKTAMFMSYRNPVIAFWEENSNKMTFKFVRSNSENEMKKLQGNIRGIFHAEKDGEIYATLDEDNSTSNTAIFNFFIKD